MLSRSFVIHHCWWCLSHSIHSLWYSSHVLRNDGQVARIFYFLLFFFIIKSVFICIFFELMWCMLVHFQKPNESQNSNKFGRICTNFRCSGGSGNFNNFAGILISSTDDDGLKPSDVQNHCERGNQIQPKIVLQKISFFDERQQNHFESKNRHANDCDNWELIVVALSKQYKTKVVREQSDESYYRNENGIA